MTRLSMVVAAAALLMLSIACNSATNRKEALVEKDKGMIASADSVATTAPDREEEQTPIPNGNGQTAPNVPPPY